MDGRLSRVLAHEGAAAHVSLVDVARARDAVVFVRATHHAPGSLHPSEVAHRRSHHRLLANQKNTAMHSCVVPNPNPRARRLVEQAHFGTRPWMDAAHGGPY